MPGCWTCRRRKVKCRDFISTSESPSGSHSSADDSCPNCRRLKLHCFRTKPSTSEEESDAAVRGWKPLRKRSGVLSKISHGGETNGSPLNRNGPKSTALGDDVFGVRDSHSHQDHLTAGGSTAEPQSASSSNTGMQSTPPILDLGIDAMSSQSNIFAAMPSSSGVNSLFPWDTGQIAMSAFDIVDPWTITTVSTAGHGNVSTGNGQLYVVNEEDEGSALRYQYPGTNDYGPERTWYKSLADVKYPDQDLIAHYLTIMSNFQKIRDDRFGNIYITIFPMALFAPPLFSALMAWSEDHLVYTKKRILRSGGSHYRRALSLIRLPPTHGRPLPQAEADTLLATLWSLSSKEFFSAAPVERLASHLQMLARYLTDNPVAFSNLGPVGLRLAVWLCCLGNRTAMSSFNLVLPRSLISLFQSQPNFVDNLRKLAPTFHSKFTCSVLLDRVLSLISASQQRAMAVGLPREETAREEWLDLTVEALCIKQQLNDLYEELAGPLERLEQLGAGPGQAMTGTEAEEYNIRFVAMHYHAAVIMYERFVDPSSTGDIEKSQKSARAILNSTFVLSRSATSDWGKASAILPMPLLISAVEIKDHILSDWALRLFQEAGAVAVQFHRTANLLKKALELQSKLGKRIDLKDLLGREDFVV